MTQEGTRYSKGKYKLQKVFVSRFRSFGIGHCVAVWQVPSSSGSRHTPLDTEDEGTTILPNTVNCSPNTMLSHCQCLSVHWMQIQPIYTAHYILFSQHFAKHSTSKKVFQIKDINLILLYYCQMSHCSGYNKHLTCQSHCKAWLYPFLIIEKISLWRPRHTKWQDCEISLRQSGSPFGDSIQHQNCSRQHIKTCNQLIFVKISAENSRFIAFLWCVQNFQ